MSYFVKAAEVWLVSADGQSLELSSASYLDQREDTLKEFQSTSQNTTFGIDEGLPGKTWAERRPIIWTDLTTEHFKRSEVAQIGGLVCGLSIPVYAGEFLLGIVVLFFAADDQSAGAVEVWHNRDYYDNELRLVDGYYGEMHDFEFISRRLTILRGRGLPGVAWKEEKPIIMADLGESTSFMRARNARECGITTALAVPFFYTGRDVQIVNLFSTAETPAANRFEVWRPDDSGLYLLYSEGYSADGRELSDEYRGVSFARGEEAMGQVWFLGRPVVKASSQAENEFELFIPYLIDGSLKAVVKIVF